MLPQLEGAREAGKDVLYFVDPGDEFIARMLDSYDGHKCENVASGADSSSASVTGHEDLIARIEKQLNGKATVTATDKLKSYPVCLAAKGDVSLEMERVMDAMGGGLKAQRVLQVNFDHPVIKGLETADDARFADTVTVLYNEALLAEGYRTEPDFIASINRLIAEQAQGEVKTEKAKSEPVKKTATATKKTTTAAKTTAKSGAAKTAKTVKKSDDKAE